jgi:hypothetical protein
VSGPARAVAAPAHPTGHRAGFGGGQKYPVLCRARHHAATAPARSCAFFRYRELGRICIDVLRDAKAPVALERIATVVMQIKGLPDDKRLRRHVTDIVRASFSVAWFRASAWWRRLPKTGNILLHHR